MTEGYFRTHYVI